MRRRFLNKVLLGAVAFPLARSLASGPTFELVHLQLLHRHGDRAPNVELEDAERWEPRLPSEEELRRLAALAPVVSRRDGSATPGGDGDRDEALCLPKAGGPWGRLTKKGILQLNELGASLRSEFAQLDGVVDTKAFPPPAEPGRLRVYSTGPPLTTTRTVESLRAFLDGLYPDGVAVGIELRLTDAMICDRAMRPEAQKRLEKIQEARVREPNALLELRKHVTAVLLEKGLLNQEKSRAIQPGKWIGPALKFTALMEVLQCYDDHGDTTALGMTELITPEGRDLIRKGAVDRWYTVYNDSPEGRLVGHFGAGQLCRHFLRTVLAAAKRTANGESCPPELVVYSGHDATLISAISTLGLDYRGWPPYASLFRIELLRQVEVSQGARRNGQCRSRYNATLVPIG
eukprot:scaffold1435_cov267-Pinguiococcus_pyrenoidosus.AAC.23